MKKKFVFLSIFMMFFVGAHATTEDDIVSALQKTYTACIGIDEELADLKKMAGINTAITGVGTGVGIGATAVGIAKEVTDRAADTLKFERLKAIDEKRKENGIAAPTNKDIEVFSRDFEEKYKSDTGIDYSNELEKLDTKSKKLGHWRTGLMATNTATNVAGAIIAGKNKIDDDLDEQITACRTAIGELRRLRARARVENLDTGDSDTIIDACSGFETVDISKINKRARGAMISGIVGSTAGLTGTVTSGIANSNAVRNQGDGGTRDDKEKGLNTASNVLAGTATAASTAAMIFNATQIKAIKDVATVAAKCTEALK